MSDPLRFPLDPASDADVAAAIAANGASGRELAFASSSAVQAGVAAVTDITNLTITFDVTTRPVHVRAHLPAIFATSGATAGNAYITDAANTIIRLAGIQCVTTSYPCNVDIYERITVPGTYTRKVRVVRTAGGASFQVNLDATTVAHICAIEV